MALRNRTTDGYQQVELTSELLHRQSGSTQQVISTVPCRKHLPFFTTILLADLFLIGSIILFAVHSTHSGDGFSIEKQPEAPYRQFNLHALFMLIGLIYFNCQAITAYKTNYMVKHKSVSMLYQFLLQILAIFGIIGGVYFSYNAQESAQSNKSSVSHFYSIHSWVGILTILAFLIQFFSEFCSLFVTICCRKFTARMKARAVPLHKLLTIIVLSLTLATVISGLNQLARFELSGLNNKESYQDLGWPTVIINLTAISAIAGLVMTFAIIFMFKRRQAHDLPVLFKLVLLVVQFAEIVLIFVVAEYIFQVVTPHVNKVMSGEIFENTSIKHFYGNATQSLNKFIDSAKDQLSLGSSTKTVDNSTVASVANLTNQY